MSLVESNDFDALIDNKQFFHQPLKNKQEASEKFIKFLRLFMWNQNLLDYLHYQKYYKLVGIGLSRQTNTSTEQTNFIKKLEKYDVWQCFSLIKSSKKLS